ncbi:YjjG family noncanonical pyrimidine nucleotidase [Myroides pelagicus]|uniref:Noncanonical pyrimidine nucleotidase, YjjG family n=1 Tax=Myroides pelagicus TaxID=270914 RepID=A0A7K1GIL1_9FLAO|nr:YjjG family noncanonical pyrimidine nucleotidase [Myroides pelagicus]MEC4114460.1 YjjG family noncanonical pyrimidine nucleotidase [Myroides pelagicus]MTH28741.1 noncanonical pyrimidine nucleotidase, YjjG family [Myroides pelagicus]
MRLSYRDKTDVFFDLDHTLWDFERNSALAFHEVIKRLKLPFAPDTFLDFYVPINAAYWEKYSLNLVSKEELRIGRIRDTFEQLSYQSDEYEIRLLGDNYLQEMPNHNHLFDGVLEVLEYLQDKYQLHIITNGFNEVQDKKLKRSGIEPYFKTVTNSEIAGVSKPNPQIFNFALNAANANAAQSIMIGDNLMADVKGALAVGMDAIYYNPQVKLNTKDYFQITDLIELKKLL